MQPVKVPTWSDAADREPVGALADGVDLVAIPFVGPSVRASAGRRPELRARQPVDAAADRLRPPVRASAEPMSRRACAHRHLPGFCIDDLTTSDPEPADVTGVADGEVRP